LTHPHNMCRILHMSKRTQVTTGEIATKGGVHRTTVHHWERTGKIKPVQVVNGIRLFDADAIDKFLAAREADATTAS